MPAYSFTLRLETDRLDEEQVERAYEGGLHDFTFVERAGHAYVGVDREAEGFADAVVSAIDDVESVLGIRVAEVEPEEYVTVSEIAARVVRTRQNIGQLASGERGRGDFPAPVQTTGERRLWRWSDVADWFARYEGAHEDGPRFPEVLTYVNGLLAERRGRILLQAASSDERHSLERLAKRTHRELSAAGR